MLVFKTRNSVQNLMRGEFTIGGNMSAVAGPVGREASAGTDPRLKAEIYSYSRRARGLFAGVEVNGSKIQLEALKTQTYYQTAGLRPDGTPITGTTQLPLEAPQFLATLQNFEASSAVVQGQAGAGNATLVPGQTAPGSGSAVLPPNTPPLRTGALPAVENTRLQLRASSQRLSSMLDDSWRSYLTLPAAVFLDTSEVLPTVASLQTSLQRFDAVASDTRYGLLQKQPEFQQTHKLLKEYLQQVQKANASAASSSRPPQAAVSNSLR